MTIRFIGAWAATLVISSLSFATEPNNTFATATVLSTGVLSVADELTPANFPDTMLAIRDHFGSIYHVDDNGSPLGDGSASSVGGVPTNSESIDFSVSGWPDREFVGSHSESGYYEVFVDVYDFDDDLLDSFSEVQFLQPGIVHDFSYSNFEWIDGSYDVYIDNAVGLPDVDFFTFTGLPPGAAFTAQTLDPDLSQIDTYMGWFDSGGVLLQADDDGGGGPFGWLSLITGVVPANGMLTFAVTGYGDDDFIGDHGEFGTYELRLELEAAGLPGDFNHDNTVDAADYVVWRKSNGSQQEFNAWRANFGQSAGSGGGFQNASPTAAPEPTCIFLCVFAGALCLLLARR